MKDLLKKILTDITTGADNMTFSSKRIAGFISLIATLIYPYIKHPIVEMMWPLVALTTAFWGLTSYDNLISVKSNNPTPANNS